MKAKNRFFFQALAVFLAVLCGAMFVRQTPPSKNQPAVQEKNAPEAPPLPAAEKDRFAKTVSFAVDPKLTQSLRWMPGTVDDIPVWRDGETGLVWRGALDNIVVRDLGREKLGEARAACAALSPAGAWALPLSQEMDAAQRSGLPEADPASRRSWLTYTYFDGYALPLGRVWDRKNNELAYFVRCVAKTL